MGSQSEAIDSAPIRAAAAADRVVARAALDVVVVPIADDVGAAPAPGPENATVHDVKVDVGGLLG